MYRLFKTIEEILLTVSNLVWSIVVSRILVAPHRLSSEQQSKSVFWIMNKEIDVFPEMHRGAPEQGSPAGKLIFLIMIRYFPMNHLRYFLACYIKTISPRSYYTSASYCKILKKWGFSLKKIYLKSLFFN